MTLSGSITFFRTQWAARLLDTCVINRPSLGALNTGTGVYTPTDTPQYSGTCLVRPQSPQSVQFGEELVEMRGYLVAVPHNEADVAVDDVVTVTSTRDLQLNGKRLVVRNVRTDTYNTVRKFDCEDNQGGP